MTPLALLIQGLAALALGVYALRSSYIILVRHQPVITPTGRIALWILRVLYGDERANRRLIQLSDPRPQRLNGVFAFFTGGFLTFYGVITLFSLALAIAPLLQVSAHFSQCNLHTCLFATPCHRVA
jgi:hypothetical protein